MKRQLVILSLCVVVGVGCGASGETETAPASRADGHHQVARGGHGADASAREEGRQACRGMTPREAAEHYVAAALRAGATKRFAELSADPPPSVAESSGYPRLVGALYATTVPAPRRAEAAAGCAEELAAH